MEVSESVGDLSDEQTLRLAIRALMEVVESPKNIEIAYLKKDTALTFLEKERIEKIVEEVEKEKKEAEEKKGKATGGDK